MSTDSPIPLVVPQLSVNEDTVTVSRVFATPGKAIKAGDIVLSLTTSKVDMDLEAPSDGFFWPVVQVKSIGPRRMRQRRGQPKRQSTGRPSLASTLPRYRADRASFANGTWRHSMRAG
jgi:hypothetical protein